MLRAIVVATCLALPLAACGGSRLDRGLSGAGGPVSRVSGPASCATW